MENGLQYNYSKKIWKPCSTATDGDCFFHAVFGTRDADYQPYRDKHAKFRRMYWTTFLSYYNGGDLTGALLDLLQRCFNANDRYLDKRVDNPDNYTEYIEDVVVPDYWVMVEEIPVFAALENIRIILFIDNGKEPVVFESDADILGRFPFRSINPVREVVICLFDNHFSRLNPYVESINNEINYLTNEDIQDQEISRKVVENPYFIRKKTFEKRGSAGIEGGLYQVNLMTMILLNGLMNVEDWRMSTENKEAGKLDDLIFEYLPSEFAILLQAKHKENEAKHKITYNDLTSVDKKHDFGLPKYFVSYQQVRSKFKVQNVVICTNVGFDEKTTKGIFKVERLSSESVLYFKGSKNICYSFNSSKLPGLKQNILKYCEKYENGEAVPTSESDMDDFFAHFRFFPNCLGENILDNVIEETVSSLTLSTNLDKKSIFTDIHKRMVAWFREKKGRYLTQVEARAFFCDIRSNKFCDHLNQYDISFEEKNLPFCIQRLQRKERSCCQQQTNELSNPTKVEHIVIPEKDYILNVVKIYQALSTEHKAKALFIDPEENIEVIKQVIDAFIVQHYTILVMACHKQIEMDVAREIGEKLIEILNHYNYKHVVLIAEEKNNLAVQIKTANGNYYEALVDNITFTDLRIDTQEKIKRKKNIKFQGNLISLEELFRSSTNDVLDQIVDIEMLVKLSKDDEINVGLELEHLDNYYVHRSFNRNGQNIPEENVCCSVETSNEKVILISDTAGMGKSTVLTRLAIAIKENYPHLWVVRFDLNNYTHIMKAISTQGGKSISMEQLLDSWDTSKLKSEFEKKLFTTRQRVVLMLDAVDEVSPRYTELVKSLLKDSLNKDNLAKIFVTLRPHVCKNFEKLLKLKPFTLEPFSEGDQIAFLKKYWTEQLALQDNLKKNRCENYAKALIQKMSIWIDEKNGNTFAGIPLQTRMMAEVFQEKNKFTGKEPMDWEGCKEFISSNNDQPIVPDRINLIQLYEMFIVKKRDIFIREKSNPTGSTPADEALEEVFEKCHEYHRLLALKVIFDPDQCDIFTCHRSIEWPVPSVCANNLLRVGVVQGENMKFIHRTFTEFFVAECLIIELECEHLNEAFQTFFMDHIMCDTRFYVIRAFLDSFVQKVLCPLEHKFHYYFRNSHSIRDVVSEYLYLFAKEGCAGILNFFMKCIDLNIDRHILTEYIYIIKGKKQYHYKTPLEMAATYGHLNVVKLLLKVGAENCMSKSPYQTANRYDAGLNENKYFVNINALLAAATRGHLGVVKFLLDEIEDVNVKDRRGNTALHLAAGNGQLEVVTYLVDELKADVNIKDERGRTALYRAVGGSQVDVVDYLVNKAGADVDLKDNIGRRVRPSANNLALRLEIYKHLGLYKKSEN